VMSMMRIATTAPKPEELAFAPVSPGRVLGC